jgi:exodeoxyribonuclease-5/exodeoxyribonuclease V alpha subunit
LLGVASRSEGDGWGFVHNENNPLPFRFIFIDEASMVDIDLLASLLRACATGTHIMFIGDPCQLPPVGHGAPLRDMISAGVSAGELREIVRNDGTIVRACAAIRDGKNRFPADGALDPPAGRNLKIIETANNAASVEKIVGLLRTIRDRKLFDPIWQCQVIVAVNKKSELSRADLNKRLQTELNPGGKRAGGNPFKVGDKIVCLKNGLYPTSDDAGADENQNEIDGKVFVANGEQAEAIDVAERITTARLDAPKRLIKIPRGKEGVNGNGNGSDHADDENENATNAGCQWDLAYAISCHKSQGSEWPCVIVALDEYPGARMVCSREWLYTALSRAKTVCLPVGKQTVAESMIRRQAIQKRKTFLSELITENQKNTEIRKGNGCLTPPRK